MTSPWKMQSLQDKIRLFTHIGSWWFQRIYTHRILF